MQQINCGRCFDVIVGQCPTRKIILKFLTILELWLNFNYLSYTIFPREKTWSSGYDLFFQPKGQGLIFFSFFFLAMNKNEWKKNL